MGQAAQAVGQEEAAPAVDQEEAAPAVGQEKAAPAVGQEEEDGRARRHGCCEVVMHSTVSLVSGVRLVWV